MWRELYDRHAAPLPPARPLLPPLLRLLLPQQVLLPHPSACAPPASASAPGTPRHAQTEHHALQRQRAGEQGVDHESVLRLQERQASRGSEGRSGTWEVESSNEADPGQQHQPDATRPRPRVHAGPAIRVPPATDQPPLPAMPKALQGAGSLPLPPRPATLSGGPLDQQQQQRLQRSKPYEHAQLRYTLTSYSSWHGIERAASGARGGGAGAGAARGPTRGMGLWPAPAPHLLLRPAPRSIDLVRSLPPPPYLTTSRSQSYG